MTPPVRTIGTARQTERGLMRQQIAALDKKLLAVHYERASLLQAIQLARDRFMDLTAGRPVKAELCAAQLDQVLVEAYKQWRKRKETTPSEG